MTNQPVTVIKIMPQPELAAARKRRLRVAAYCRVSTDEEEQLTSYEAQMTYYTDKIKANPDWDFAGIFADEGISGTRADKRTEFQKMIRKCRRGGIDMILTKTISRFARNTVDCLKYTRELKGLGIAVVFEQGNINTLESDSEVILTLLGALAQAESENISHSVKWGMEEAMREGKPNIQYARLYGYERGEDNRPQIIPDQAEVVRRIYSEFLAGHTLRQIQQNLEAQGIPNVQGLPNWTISCIRSILSNEKYYGDVLMHKTFVQDCISKKVVKNTGQRPMYLALNYHQGIVSRQVFDAAQAEIARRTSRKSITEKYSSTGLSRYSGKYALTQRLFCGECGSPYTRCTWARNGEKRVLWRCAKRRDYGRKYCKNSPNLDEGPLQAAILAALNTVVSQRESLLEQIGQALYNRIIPLNQGELSKAGLRRRIEQIGEQTRRLLDETSDNGGAMAHIDQFKAYADQVAELRQQLEELEKKETADTAALNRVSEIQETLTHTPLHLGEWDEDTIRQLVESVKVISATKISVEIKGGITVEQEI